MKKKWLVIVIVLFIVLLAVFTVFKITGKTVWLVPKTLREDAVYKFVIQQELYKLSLREVDNEGQRAYFWIENNRDLSTTFSLNMGESIEIDPDVGKLVIGIEKIWETEHNNKGHVKINIDVVE